LQLIFILYLQLLQPSLYYPLADLTRYRGMALLLLQALQYIHYYFRKKIEELFFFRATNNLKIIILKKFKLG